MEKVIGFVAAAAVAGAAYWIFKNRDSKIQITNEEDVDVLTMKDVVSFFKSLDLKQEESTPFVANAKSPKIKQMLSTQTEYDAEYNIFIGVFNKEQNKMLHHKLIHAKSVDEEIKGILESDELTILQ